MKKSILCVILCILLLIPGNTVSLAQENTQWKVTKQTTNGETFLLVAAIGLPQDTSAMELTVLLPSDKKITEMIPTYQNPDGSVPEYHFVSKEDKDTLKVTFYYLNRKENSFQNNKTLFKVKVTDGSSLTKSDIALTNYILLDQQAKVIKTQSGTLDFEFSLDNTDDNQKPDDDQKPDDSNNNQPSGNNSNSTSDTSTIVTKVTESKKENETAKTITTTNSANGTILKTVIITDSKNKVTDAYATYTLSQADVKVTDKTVSSIAVSIPEPTFSKEVTDLIKDLKITDKLPVKAVLPKEVIDNQLKAASVKEINITVSLPSAASSTVYNLTDISIPKENLITAKLKEKPITVAFQDKSKLTLYSWSFTAAALKQSDEIKKDVNLLLTVLPVKNAADTIKVLNSIEKYNGSGLTVLCSGNELLPVQAQLKIYLPEKSGFNPKDRVYLYQLNKETNKLETLVRSFNYFVDADRYVTLNVIRSAEYVLLPKAADNKIITALISQVSVPKSLTLSLSSAKKDTPVRTSLNVVLPNHLQKVNSLDEATKGSAYGGVTINFKTSNAKIAQVGKNGLITAKGEGTAAITTTVTLFSGKAKTFTTTVTVTK